MNPPPTSDSVPSTLSPGTRFGSYEILQQLGAGGMGEVYRAKDTRLDREVAIKTLSLDRCSQPEALSRFEQEARSACALNHPNIVTIYELGQVNGTHYIAMELVDGETVRKLLASGPIPFRKAVAIAAQIADGLAKAHEIGIVHRDLKPENLMVSRDGYGQGSGFRSGETACARPLPEFGCFHHHHRAWNVMGTVGYMSPEQATGERSRFSFRPVFLRVGALRNGHGIPAFKKKTHAETDGRNPSR
jgi:eukaryotic-like serine/threonine-protein kinase